MTLANTLRLFSAAAATAFFVTPVSADTVNITSDDGKVAVSGFVIAVKDRTMTVQTNVGPITFNVDTVSCEGIGCPTLALDNVLTTAG